MIRKKLRSVCLALVLCLLLPAAALAANTTVYGTIEVGGIALTNSESVPTVYATTDESGTVTTTGATVDNYNVMWDGSTLTLRNATIQQAEEYSNKSNEKIAVYRASGDLNLVLVGENTVDALGGGSAASCGINLGSGSLSISGEDGASLSVFGGTTTSGNSCGIYARGTITINSGTVNVTGESASAASYGICTGGAVTIENGTVNAASGEAQGDSCGIYTYGAVTIEDGTLNAASGEAGGNSCGIYTSNSVTIEDGTVTATGESAAGSSYGIDAGGAVTIENGTVNATSGKAEGDSVGIFAEDKNYRYSNSITINGGTVIATAGDAVGSGWYSCGIRVEGPITINGGTVNATGKTSTRMTSCGIYAVQSVNISGGTVTATGGTSDNEYSSGIFAANIESRDVYVNIKDATVTATGGAAKKGSYGILTETAGISTVTIDGNSVVRVNTTDTEGVDSKPISGIAINTTINKKSGVIFENGDGTVYGNVTLREDLTVGADESLTIPQDAALTIPDGTTLTNSGTITNEGTLTNNGTLTIGQGGALTGNVNGKPVIYAVTVLTDGNGTASASEIYAAADDTVTLTATPDSGYHFERWEVVSGGVTVENNAFTMPAQPVTVKAIFDRNSSGSSSYTITTPDAEHGTVAASPSRASSGTTVTITVTPDEGYELGELIVTDANGDEVDLTRESATKYTFEMPRSRVTVAASFVESAPEPLPFDDVDDGDWFADAVRFVYENGMMNGTGDTTFAPDATTSRSMIVTILYRLEGEPVVDDAMDFSDVAGDAWHTDAVRWAAGEGIVGGYGGGLFGSDDAVTREQLAAILYRYAVYKGYDVSIGEDTNLLSYDDFEDLSEYAIPAMQWACGTGIVNGTSESTLTPQGEATRAQVAVMLERFCEQYQ